MVVQHFKDIYKSSNQEINVGIEEFIHPLSYFGYWKWNALQRANRGRNLLCRQKYRCI